MSRPQHQLPQTPTRIGNESVSPATSVRDLSIYVDSDVSMRAHVSRTVSTCFAGIRQISSVRRCRPQQALVSLVVSLVHSRLDYGCATLAGLPAYVIGRLQSVLNAGARLVFSARKHDHVTPLLQQPAALAEDGTADRVQTRSTRLPLPPWSGTIVSCQLPSSCLRSRHTATSTFCNDQGHCRSSDPSLDCR